MGSIFTSNPIGRCPPSQSSSECTDEYTVNFKSKIELIERKSEKIVLTIFDIIYMQFMIRNDNRVPLLRYWKNIVVSWWRIISGNVLISMCHHTIIIPHYSMWYLVLGTGIRNVQYNQKNQYYPQIVRIYLNEFIKITWI